DPSGYARKKAQRVGAATTHDPNVTPEVHGTTAGAASQSDRADVRSPTGTSAADQARPRATRRLTTATTLTIVSVGTQPVTADTQIPTARSEGGDGADTAIPSEVDRKLLEEKS